MLHATCHRGIARFLVVGRGDVYQIIEGGCEYIE